MEYTIEDLIATFEENSSISKKMNKESLREFKKNNPEVIAEVIRKPIEEFFI